MENIKSQIKYVLSTLLGYVVTLMNFYISMVFFLFLVADETIHGKPNLELKEKLVDIIDKVIEIPETLRAFFNKENLQRRFNFYNIFQ
ncbi:MAG: hypothetical protein K2Q22_07230 [Cytophagales bacterium]|nr:hypothetical protein [Cytophagales bacterium]